MKTEKLTYTVAAILSLVLLLFSILGGGGASVLAATSTDTVSRYEQRNVMDDLDGATVDGEGIDLTLYNFDEHKNVQILSFVEFCYSYQKEKQTEYGLYVYVYNPRGYDWTKNEQLNKIQLRTGGNVSGSFSKYPLKYLNRSESAGYEGLFYKFKIELTEAQKSTVLGSLNSTERIYEVGEIELYNTGVNATAYDVSNTYKYKGYAEGYGSESSEGDTLTCASDGLLTLTLDVHATQYRPEGTNGKDKYTRDSLHSVYFSIPNKILNEYGGLSAVHATWLNAVTNLGLVTGNYDAYAAIKQYIGKDVSEFSEYPDKYKSDLNFSYVSEYGYDRFGSSTGVVRGRTGYNFHWNFGNLIENNLQRLDYVFWSGSAENSADSYRVSSEELAEWLLWYTENVTPGRAVQSLVNGKYSRALFSSVDDEFTDVNIQADDKFSLTTEKLGQSFWEKIFGGSHVISSTTFNNIEAIHAVTATDFKANTSLTCKELYISEADYKDFKAYYDLAKIKQETVFLFRYQVSDYVSEEASELTYGNEVNNTNAYFFRETVNLDFDIIDVTCSKGEIDTVIPVIMSPIEIIPDVDPPLITTPDNPKGKRDWWKIVIAVLSIIFILFILNITGLLNLIGNAIAWIVCLPFRAIGALFKAIFSKKD